METNTKIIPRGKISRLAEKWRLDKLQIVFTNGCFDLIHLGHIDYLEKARQLGDKLIIGLNTDRSVSELKGPKRPINDEHARSRLLAALAFVDAVVLFDESTPEQLIRDISPDILVKGNDYEKKNIVGANYVMEKGGKVITLQLVEGYSTTALINKIKNI